MMANTKTFGSVISATWDWLWPRKRQKRPNILLPPGYEGDVPEGYFIVKSQTYHVWLFMRGSIANGLETVVFLIYGLFP